MDFAKDFYFETDEERKQVWHLAKLAKEILESEYEATENECEIIESLQLIELNEFYMEQETRPTDEEIKNDIRKQIECFDDYPTEEMLQTFQEEKEN